MIKDLSSNNLHFIGSFEVCCPDIHYTLLSSKLGLLREQILNAQYNGKTELVEKLETKYSQLLQERNRYK